MKDSNKSWINMIIGGVILLAIIKFIIYLFLPSNPIIIDNGDRASIRKQILDVVKRNSREIQFEAMQDNSRIPVEYSFALKKAGTRMENCGYDTKCIVNEYHNLMDEWGSPMLRKQVRCGFIIHYLGIFGEPICENLSILL